MKFVALLLIPLLLYGCVAYPKSRHDADNKRCDLITKSYTLEVNESGLKVLKHTGDPIGALAISGVVFSVSTVVSGSMVVVGNTAHFLEKQGSCEDSFLNEKVLAHIGPLLKQGGEVISLPENKAEIAK